MPLPRMTTRRWMITVVAVGVLFAGEMIRRRWNELSLRYKELSAVCERGAFARSCPVGSI